MLFSAAQLRKWREALAFRIAPRLPRLLRKSENMIERLEIRAEENQEWKAEAQRRRDDLLAELQEAASLADGAPWIPGGEGHSAAGKMLTEAAKTIQSMPLRETIYGMAELEIALDDRGWKRLLAQSQYEFSRFGIQSIMLICRLYTIKNSLARRGVDTSAFYVFGRGLSISSNDEAANEGLNAFFNDPRNASQFSHTALVKKEKATYTDGNIFWAFFSDPLDGRLEVRGIDAVEISEIICDPDDNDTPWFYRRDWTETTFTPDGPKGQGGEVGTKQRTAWYFALDYEDLPNFPKDIRKIQGFDVALDNHKEPIPVMHLKDGDLPGWKFGCPRMYPCIDWLRAYRRVLEDLCTMWRALSRFAWNVETEGGAPAIAAFKQVLATTLANDLTQIESNPVPVTGSAYISGPANKVTPFQTAGATMNPDNARRVLLMVCAGFGLGEHMFGDATTGSLATAASLERPTELMFLERQEVWREVIQRQGRYALRRSVNAPKGKLREALAKRQGKETSEFDPKTVKFIETKRQDSSIMIPLREADGEGENPAANQTITIDVKFPDILAHDIKERVAAIVSAMTLDGKEPIGIDQRIGTALLLSELGVEDVQAVIEAMFPEDTYETDRTLEPALPTTIKADAPAPQADAADRAGEEQPMNLPNPTKEALGVSRDAKVIERAVRQILAAARHNLKGRRAA